MSQRFNIFNKGDTDYVTPGMQLEYVASEQPDEIALLYVTRGGAETSLTWREFRDNSNKMAHYLASQGVGMGDKVLVSYKNCIEHITAALAIWKVGACYVPVSEKQPIAEILEVCRIINPRYAFTNLALCENTPGLSMADFYEAMASYPTHLPEDRVAIPNKVNMSGGTSGKLKLIQQNFPAGNSDLGLKSWISMSGQNFKQRVLLTGALFHGAPHSVAYNCLFMGGTLIIPESLSAENILSCIIKYKIQQIFMVPTLMYRMLKLDTLRRDSIQSLEALYHTGGYCSPFLKQKWIDLLSPERVYEMYSMSEIIGMTYIRGDEWLKHRGSVGRNITGKISIKNEQMDELAPYEIGEIYMQSPDFSDTVQYLNFDQLPVHGDGFRTVGDLGYVDEDGYLYFVDRRNDMIVTGGENVFASEVENALIMNEDVLDAVVIGIPDEEWGRRIHAIVESRRDVTEHSLREFLVSILPAYKIPKTFEFLNEIPRKENGKVNRKELTDRMAAMERYGESKL